MTKHLPAVVSVALLAIMITAIFALPYLVMEHTDLSGTTRDVFAYVGMIATGALIYLFIRFISKSGLL